MTAPSFLKRRTTWAVLASCIMAACSPGSDVGPDATPISDEISVATIDCDRLADLQLAGLAVNEAAALEVSERTVRLGRGPTRTIRLEVPHCKVMGVIDAIIHFELLMPDTWNGKFLMGGGGGFVGSVQNHAQDGLSRRTALERGYATVGTDTGHTGSGGSWALNNEEAKVNFAHRAVHRTTEVAKALIQARYAKDIEYSYFFGCSRGGGQAMIAAQRYPEDFDGLVAGAPAIDWTGFAAANIHSQQQVFPDPNNLETPVITKANRELLAESLRDSCDAEDGVADGILNDPQSCALAVAKLPSCQAGSGERCLTETQRAAIEAIYAGPKIGGKQLYPGLPFGGETDAGGWDSWITRAEQSPLSPGMPNRRYFYGTELAKYFVFNDPDWSYAGYTFEDYEEMSAEAAALLNATDPDLSEFRDAGGKLILWHGWSDAGISALDSIEYYESVKQQNSSLQDYFRMFLMPGVGHCVGGPGPSSVDWITAMERWVEDDVAPYRLIASKFDPQGNKILERPLCTYPHSATYDGRGDPNVATSFTCSE